MAILVFSVAFGVSAFAMNTIKTNTETTQNIQQETNLADTDKPVVATTTQESTAVVTPAIQNVVDGVTAEVARTNTELQKKILLRIIQILQELIQYYESIQEIDAELLSVKVSYDDEGHVTIIVTDSDGVRSNFAPPTQDEDTIINILSLEYGVDEKDVLKKSSFSYEQLPRGTVDVDDVTLSTYVSSGHTKISMKHGYTTHTYWFDTTNVREATQELAEIYRVPTHKLWERYE